MSNRMRNYYEELGKLILDNNEETVNHGVVVEPEPEKKKKKDFEFFSSEEKLGRELEIRGSKMWNLLTSY